MKIVLTVADHDQNGFVSLASTLDISEEVAREIVWSIDGLVDPEAEPDGQSSFAFILDLMEPNGNMADTGQRLLPLQVAMAPAPEAVFQWLEERPYPDAVIDRVPMPICLNRLLGYVSNGSVRAKAAGVMNS